MKLLFVLALHSCALVDCLPQQSTGTGSLDAKFKAKGKLYFGVAADRGTLSKPKTAAIVQREFGQVTPENSMKWDSTERSPGQYGWQGSDFLVNWAMNNSKIVRGHTLLWHSQLPQWVGKLSTAAELKSTLEKHTTAEISRYKGRIYAWDVANELLDESGNFRKSPWNAPEKAAKMDDMVKIAFEAARNADPAAKLYINDYNLDAANYPKTRAMVQKVRQWRAQGIPIDGVGSQGHLKRGQAAGFKAALQALCDVAPECAVTELDVEGADPQEYATAVRACLEIQNCVGITVWGVSDADSWRKDRKPLMFDADYKEKEAFTAVVQAIS